MKWFSNLKIGIKLMVGFLIVAFIAGMVGFTGIANIHRIKTADQHLYENNVVPLARIGQIASLFQRIRVSSLYLMIYTEPQKIEAEIQKIQDYRNQIGQLIEAYQKKVSGANNLRVLAEYQATRVEYIKHLEKLIAMARNTSDKQVIFTFATSEAYQNSVKAYMDTINTMVELQTADAKIVSDSNERIASQATVNMIIIVLFGIFSSVCLGLIISKMISKPVTKLAEAADRLALGDINVNVEVKSSDEVGILMQSFGKMIENIREQALAVQQIAEGDLTVAVRVKSENDLLGIKLNEMVKTNHQILNQLTAAADQVAVGSGQVATASQALSQGTTEQASTIEELNSTMTVIAAQTKQNALNANQANELAVTAKENAVKGNEQMQGMLNAMSEINNSSANISKIIKVIDEIAFQTNILALNAAVEAARAGQHGKGFAVVAEEVRNLAARSANAAKETTTMIEGSIKKVADGMKIADTTADALGHIVTDVARMANLVNEIATASNQQASGISECNQGISQISLVIQNNSATAEESAAASQELSGQAALLRNMVTRFKLNRDNYLPEPDTEAAMINARKSGSRNHPVKTRISLNDFDFEKY